MIAIVLVPVGPLPPWLRGATAVSQGSTAADDLRALAAMQPIDSHVHAFQSDPGFTAMISELHLHVLDITVADTQGIYGDLEKELARAKSFVQSSDGHASLCVTFDPFKFQEKDFSGRTVKRLQAGICGGSRRGKNLEKYRDGTKEARRQLRHAGRSRIRTHLSRDRGGK